MALTSGAVGPFALGGPPNVEFFAPIGQPRMGYIWKISRSAYYLEFSGPQPANELVTLKLYKGTTPGPGLPVLERFDVRADTPQSSAARSVGTEHLSPIVLSPNDQLIIGLILDPGSPVAPLNVKCYYEIN